LTQIKAIIFTFANGIAKKNCPETKKAPIKELSTG
jgi:hypothetical protein